MRALKILAVPALALSLAACQAGPRETLGGLGGAALGGLIGSQIGSGAGRGIAIAAGVIIGGLIGSHIGRQLDDRDRAYAARAANRSFRHGPTGSTSSWRNPNSGNSGRIRPTTGVYTGRDGRPCRDFHHRITLANGRTQTVRGTACQNPDGTWETVS